MPDQISYAYIPFSSKSDDSQRTVEGYVSSADVDLDHQIVDPDWLKSELPTWLSSWGNIREQHRPDSAVGKAKSVDLTTAPGPHLSARIVDDQAWNKVKEGVYNGFSVGIKSPRIVFDGTAKNGRINGGKLIEISIVDRPANDAARFTLVKRAGRNEWKLGAAGPVIEDSVKAALMVDVAKCDLAGCDCDCTPTVPDPTCTCDCPLCAGARDMADKAAISTADQNDLPDDAFAYIESGGSKDDSGKTTPRSLRHYPIHDDAHIRNALSRAAAQINAGGEPATIAEKALPAIRRAAKARGIGEDNKEKAAMSAATQAPAPDAALAAASHVEHKHPFKGVHNHEHDDGRGDTHTHAHLHDDDDIHEHTHLDGKDARMLTPEQQAAALKLREAGSSYFAAKPNLSKAMLPGHPTTGNHEHDHNHDGATHAHDHHHSDDGSHEHAHSDEEAAMLKAAKAASDVLALNPGPGTPGRPTTLTGDLSALLKDVAAQLEALANQTDKDRDGDADNPVTMSDGGQRTAPDFQDLAGNASVATPSTLSLTFATEADLVKFIDARIAARGAVDFVTKAAAAEPLSAIPDIAKLAGGIAKGLEALADRTKATQDELATTRAALTAAQTDIAKIKEMATPPKGSVFAIDKGIGFDPERINPDGSSKTAVPAAGSTEWLANRVAALSVKEREDLAVQAYKQFHPSNR